MKKLSIIITLLLLGSIMSVSLSLPVKGEWSTPIQITYNTVIDDIVCISNDGSKIAFESNVGVDSEIFVVNSDGTGLTQVTNNTAHDTSPSISGDGSKIAFRSNVDGDYEIFVVNSDGTGLTQVTNNTTHDTEPCISGDGSKIAFRMWIGLGLYYIFIINSDGTGLTQVTNNNTVTNYEPSISGDGSKIAFRSNVDGDWEIFVVNSDGTGLKQLTTNNAQDMGPSISNDGSKIAFTSNLDGDWEIFVINSDGTDLTQLTNNTVYEYPPCISGDGTTIAYASSIVNLPEIFVVNSDGTGLTQVTNNETVVNYDPSISGDGSKIAFRSNVDGDYEIFSTSIETSSVEYYDLSVSVSGSGSTNPSSGVHTFTEDTEVSVTASPSTGWIFSHWLLDSVNIGSNNPYTINMDTDHSLTAIFSENPSPEYELSLSVSGSGSTNPTVGVYTYEENSTVDVTAIESEDWTFSHWLLDSVNVGSSNPFSVTINFDHNLIAVFAEIQQESPTASFTYSPLNPVVNDTITFDASGCNDNDGTIVSYFWDFGDGDTSTTQNPTHVYVQDGSFNVTLTITDNDGLSDDFTLTIAEVVIPEFSSWMILPLFLVITLVSLLIKKKV